MMRLVLTYALPLLLPAAAYFLWLWFTRRRPAGGAAAGEEQGPVPAGPEMPWLWLALAGLVLLAATLSYVALTSGGPPDGVYEPPRLEDGRVVPGRIVD